ncbi:MAG TPA: SPO1 DNA polymerase [Gammaproteobacteria bacterium]|jgi:uracil-DNA glycosylase family 4|nr:SPO1 DNA polymerase [Gammaproteobacteria bacterium]
MAQSLQFKANCRACPRLSHHLDEVKAQFPDYFSRPVPPFGDRAAQLLIVGLAPGLHGANRTGRPFTGDFAGILLYETLYDFGFASRAESTSADDGLRLTNCRITNAVKCLPPANKPNTDEIKTCNAFLRAELETMPQQSAVLALGSIAHQSVLRALELRQKDFAFAHGAQHQLPTGWTLFDSYHCSRYNTQTKRLTTEMFRAIFRKLTDFLNRMNE